MRPLEAIVDTNKVFSALIPKASPIRDILLDTGNTLYAPAHLQTEISLHEAKLLRYSKLSFAELRLLYSAITERIQFVPLVYISLKSKQMAYDLCHDIDIKDTPFVALCIELNLPLWTGDEKLKRGLRSKGFQLIVED